MAGKIKAYVCTAPDRDIGPPDPSMSRVMISIGDHSFVTSPMDCKEAEKLEKKIKSLIKNNKLELVEDDDLLL